MTNAKIRLLLLAIHRGEIASQDDALRALGVSTATFWRLVREARRQGVVIESNGRGGALDARGELWRVKNWGPYRSERPKKAA